MVDKGDRNRLLFDLSTLEDKGEDKDKMKEDKEMEGSDNTPALERGEAMRGGRDQDTRQEE